MSSWPMAHGEGYEETIWCSLIPMHTRPCFFVFFFNVSHRKTGEEPNDEAKPGVGHPMQSISEIQQLHFQQW